MRVRRMLMVLLPPGGGAVHVRVRVDLADRVRVCSRAVVVRACRCVQCARVLGVCARLCACVRTRMAKKKKWASLTYVCARAGESGNERNEWRERDGHLGMEREMNRRRERWRVSDCLEG